MTAVPRASRAANPVSAPTAAQLLDFARSVAADAARVATLPLGPEGRTWVRLEGPGGAEAWLLGWPPGAETGWHDHGGSYGVFVTAAGELTEESLAVPLPTEGWRSLELADGLDRRRVLPEGKGAGVRPQPRPPGLQRLPDLARGVRARVLPEAAADPPLQPQGQHIPA